MVVPGALGAFQQEPFKFSKSLNTPIHKPWTLHVSHETVGHTCLWKKVNNCGF